ncbi:glycoside hydrolase family 18 protein [Paraflavitalea sp. CAU 1676]|nr:glycoside hydrolase family 18 protein [Paraflavitalea sp. CAU 1676]
MLLLVVATHSNFDNPVLHAEDSTNSRLVPGTTVSDSIFPPPHIDFKIVGYVLDFRKPALIPNSKLKQCNVINWSSARLLKNNKLFIKHPENLKAFVAKSQAANCKILLSITGYHQHFKTMAGSASSRRSCIQQIMDLLRSYDLNGVDIDWEFPSRRDKTDSLFSLFLQELSDSCHTRGSYYLSCAITPGVNGGRRSSAINQQFLHGDAVDWFNIMIYDAFSVSRPHVQHSTAAMAKESYLYWMRVRKMKKEKCVVGLPFYGRPSGIRQSPYIRTYAAILRAGGDPFSDSAVISIDSSKMLKDSIAQYTIYYNGIKTIRLKAGAAGQLAGGIMFWALGYDVNNRYSLVTAALNATRRKQKPR